MRVGDVITSNTAHCGWCVFNYLCTMTWSVWRTEVWIDRIFASSLKNRHLMELRGLLLVPTAYNPGENHGTHQKEGWYYVENNISEPSPGNKPRYAGFPVSRLIYPDCILNFESKTPVMLLKNIPTNTKEPSSGLRNIVFSVIFLIFEK
jgi:hypothetical protein